MNRHSRHLLALAIPVTLLVAGCANQGTKPTTTTPAPAPTAQSGSRTSTPSHAPASSPLPSEKTGIPACDDYLASYKGCHRAAGIYAPDTIDKHYREMRDTLVEESRDKSKRADLATRCVSLTNLLKKALHGKSCAPAQPAEASSSQ